MGVTVFGKVVAARTRLASEILGQQNLLATYQSAGGLAADLQSILDAGRRAEACSLNKSQSKGSAAAATVVEHQDFAALQREYHAVMSVAHAVRGDLARQNAPADLIAQVDQILKNESAVVVQTGADGKAKGRRSESLEALRSEIEKDARALQALTGPAATALAARLVSDQRLANLATNAANLEGRLADKASKKGASKDAVAAERKAVQEQTDAWTACRRLLEVAGSKSAVIAGLLKDAAQAGK